MRRDARLDRRHELAARRLLPAARRAARGSRARGLDHGAGLRTDARAPRGRRAAAHGRRSAPRRCLAAREGADDGVAAPGAPVVRARERVRRRPLARVARAARRGAVASDPFLVRVRLRVRPRAARDRLPRGDAGGRPRGDPAGSPHPTGCARPQGRALPRPQGGVLPRRLRARRRRPRRARDRPRPGPRRRADAARGVALPPARERALRRRARAARERRRGQRGGPAPDAGAAGRDRRPGAPARSSCPTARSTRSASSRSQTSSSRRAAR